MRETPCRQTRRCAKTTAKKKLLLNIHHQVKTEDKTSIFMKE